jgi:hypothetical protein
VLVHTVKWLAEKSEYRNSGPWKRRTRGHPEAVKSVTLPTDQRPQAQARLPRGFSTGSELRLARASEQPDPPEMR